MEAAQLGSIADFMEEILMPERGDDTAPAAKPG